MFEAIHDDPTRCAVSDGHIALYSAPKVFMNPLVIASAMPQVFMHWPVRPIGTIEGLHPLIAKAPGTAEDLHPPVSQTIQYHPGPSLIG